MQTELRHALWAIKGSVCVKNGSPQEARQRINKQTSTDPFCLQLGPFDSLNGLFFLHVAEEVEEVLHTPDQSWKCEALSYKAANCT